MKITANIELENDKNILELFNKNDYFSAHERTKVEIKTSKEKITFKISAEDITSLRATFNAITKNLTVYDNIKSVMKK